MPSVVCSCGKTIEVKPEWAGAFIRCRGCASKVYVPRPEEAKPAADALPIASSAPAEQAPVPEEELRACPYCAEKIRKQAVKCRFCGQSLVLGRAGGTAARPRPRPAPADRGGTAILIVAILGWVICGICHPIAWAMGASHESNCRAQGIEPSGAAKAGKILGMVGTILLGVFVVIIIIAAAAGGMK